RATARPIRECSARSGAPAGCTQRVADSPPPPVVDLRRTPEQDRDHERRRRTRRQDRQKEQLEPDRERVPPGRRAHPCVSAEPEQGRGERAPERRDEFARPETRSERPPCERSGRPGRASPSQGDGGGSLSGARVPLKIRE